jgi:hypothetical protein
MMTILAFAATVVLIVALLPFLNTMTEGLMQ